MKLGSAIAAAGTTVGAAAAVSLAVTSSRRTRAAALYAGRDLQERFIAKVMADDDLRKAIFPDIERAHLHLNLWVMYHQMLLVSRAQTWERFRVNAASLLETPTAQAYWKKAEPRFQARTGKSRIATFLKRDFDQRFVDVMNDEALEAQARLVAKAAQPTPVG